MRRTNATQLAAILRRFLALPAVVLAAPLLVGVARASHEVPGAPQMRPVALVGGTVHPVSGPAIDDGIVLFDGGKIAAVGHDVALPEGVEKIDVTGQHVYPGLIDAFTHLGLEEISMVRATNDRAETGQLNPNAKAHIAINPDSELVPVARSAGVLTVLSVPAGGLMSGTSAVVRLDGWTAEDMALKPLAGIHARWPQMAPVFTWWIETSGQEQLRTRDQALEEIGRAFESARSYHIARKAHAEKKGPPHDYNARWEALAPVLEGKLPLIVEADETQQIQSALAFAEREKIKLVLAGGYDAPECADLLKKLNVAVIVGGVHRLPRREDDAYDAAFTVPARLKQAGVRFCIASADRASMVRNLPYHAGTAAGYGLPPDDAVRAITLSAAEILGVADRIGSLESGKDATLIVTTGDVLETASEVRLAYIEGRQVELNDRQKRLWQKYKEKYRRLGVKP
jgi:imidazolonepropionase-like amidohydrolase